MKKTIFSLIFLFSTTSIVIAGEVFLEKGKVYNAQTEELKDSIVLECGQVRFHHLADPVERIVLPKVSKDENSLIPFFESVAEADPISVEDVIQDYREAHTHLSHARYFEDIMPYVSDNYFVGLTEKVTQGSDERMVVVMLQGLRPIDTEIVDVEVYNDQAKVVSKGKSSFGNIKGVTELVKTSAGWRVDSENWFSSVDRNYQSDWDVVKALQSKPFIDKEDVGRSVPEFHMKADTYAFDTNFLNLKKVDAYKMDDAFMFMFYVKRENKLDEVKGGNDLAKEDKSRHMHILWTGPKRILQEAKSRVYNDADSDVSISHHKDGYKPGEMNLRLPKKSPKQITAGVFFDF